MNAPADSLPPNQDASWPQRRTWPARIGQGAIKVLSLFVILEPIWMLLPFAGFLYGSLLQIQVLNREPALAWLAHFVFPILTGGWLGPALVALGLLIFCIGAGQIYYAKLRRRGLVTHGLYRFVRHPQYISLTLFGVGILLTWGRAITFIAFFAMMFLYYYLARSEERQCRRAFGQAYDRYAERTSFIVPGDRRLRGWTGPGPWRRLPGPARTALAFALTMGLCAALMFLIQSIKRSVQTVPYLAADLPLHAGPAATGPTASGPALQGELSGVVPFVQSGRLVVARGPYRSAVAAGFAERLLPRLRQSATLKPFLDFLDQEGSDVAIVFCGPVDKPDQPGGPGSLAGKGPSGRGPAPDPHGPYKVRTVLMRCELLGDASVADALRDKARRRIKAGCVAVVDLERGQDQDVVESDGKARGPGFPGEDRWAFFIKQFEAQRQAGFQPPPLLEAKRYDSAHLVLVRAPILRTRIDEPFAREILDRLRVSPTFRKASALAGAGGPAVAVAFPRPGPNWYREHHGKPQVSLFVMVAVLTDPSEGLESLFRPGGRRLAGAFTIEMDFAIPARADSLSTPSTIGPMRNLEERWQFFLSGVGDESGATFGGHQH